MAEEFSFIKGTKIAPAEAKKLNRDNMIVATMSPPGPREVEGQSQWWQRYAFLCPWCVHVEYALVHEEQRHTHWFFCGHCGGAFRAW